MPRNTLVKVTALLVALAPTAAFAQAAINQGVDVEAGRAVYQQYCAACHDKPVETKSPAFDSLRKMGVRAISYALTDGKMRVQGAPLTPQQVDAVTGYLAQTAQVDNGWVAANTCPADRRSVDTSPVRVGGFGLGFENHRQLSAAQAGLTTAQLKNLEVAWTLGFPQTGNMRAQPAVVGDTMFLPIADSGQLFAFDINGSPCVKWVYEHGVPLRTHVNYGTLADGRPVIVFGDAAAHVQMLEAATGKLLWRTSLRVTSVSNTTGMPVMYNGRIYAPVSSGELNMGAAPEYECCTSHGAVAALDAETGAILWVYHTMENATRRSVSRVGTQQWGPSGAPIWTTPAIDPARGVLYVGTGQNTSAPATDTSDAVLAIDLEDGSLRWKFQATANDIYLTGCMFDPNGPNCPPGYSVMKDWDFGASIIIGKRRDGSDILLAGQKNGVIWALDPDQHGQLLWTRKLGPGGPLGGIHWGMAYDANTVYVPVNKIGNPAEENGPPGLHALDVDSGAVRWSFFPEADCRGTRQQEVPGCERNFGLSAATLVVDGAVIQGSNDGWVRIFDAAKGTPLFQFDTARSFNTVNGVPAHGGSIDNASVTAANGLLLVQSGYGLLGTPGNVLIALKPR
ncbi:MAG: PQQ-binding-like beta-propeller repeat protein [Gammaproteobacteria bacterium]|nr:PQQ-binding-like beta-propeller repeat protein [Gammaproteobacteria bacterium]